MSGIEWENTTAKLGDLKPWGGNPKTSTGKQQAQLTNSFNELGQFQTVAISPDGDVYDGHQRLSALLAKHGKDYEVKALQSSRALTDEERRKIAIYSRQIGAWDWEILSAWDAPDLVQYGMDIDLLHDIGQDYSNLALMLASEDDMPIAGNDEDAEEKEEPLPFGVPDTIWPTDNEYGIPMLDITRQADAFDLPIETWGAKGRGNHAGTYHFYTEDYRFNNIWERPYKLNDTGVINAVEPNFSIYKDFPVAVAIWRTYQKRWLARYWQSKGVRIFVDLNVNPDYYDINLLGVPNGWQAFATRGYGDRLDYTEIELQQAKNKAGDNPVLFMVYGGGKKVKAWCEARAVDGVAWVSEDMDKAKGLYNEF